MDNIEKRGDILKRGRVGSLTMAVVLIFSGVFILISRYTGVSALEYFMKFWPVILFLLGGEVVYSYLKYKDKQDTRLTYDFISIGIIIIIIVVNIGLHSLTSVGMLERIKSIASQESRIYNIGNTSYKISDAVEKIVLDDVEDASLLIRTSEGDNLEIKGQVDVSSYDMKGFDEFVDKDFIRLEESGKVLYLSFNKKNSDQLIEDKYSVHIELVFPSSKMLEVSNVSSVRLDTARLDEDIVINDTNEVMVNIDKGISYNLLAQTGSKDKFLGSDQWKIEEVRDEEGHIVYYIGGLKHGESDHTIRIMNTRSIKVNNL